MFLKKIGVFCVLLVSFSKATYVSYQPEQVHLALGEKTDEMVVTWSTMHDAGESIVEYGINGFALTAYGSSDLFVDSGNEKHSQYIHNVVLKNLQPKMKYIYHVGGKLGWSPEFFFTTFQNGTKWSPRIAMFGDMGNENAQSLGRLQVS